MNWILLAITILSIAFGANAYWHLWRWAKQCQRGRIVIAYNRRVQLEAPLVEWLTWMNQLKREDAKGRVIYRNGKVSIAILKGDKKTQPSTTVKTIRNNSRAEKGKVAA